MNWKRRWPITWNCSPFQSTKSSSDASNLFSGDQTHFIVWYWYCTCEVFPFTGNGGKYLDLRKSRLHIKAKITKSDGTAHANLEKRGIINLIFKRCFLKLMSTWTEKNASRKTLIIIHGKPILMYSCLPESVLGFANADTVIQPRWRKHRECRSCSCDTYVLRKRYILTQKPRAFDLKGPLYEEFFFYLDKFLIKGVDIHFRLFWSKNEFVLMSKEASVTYKVYWTPYLRHVKSK